MVAALNTLLSSRTVIDSAVPAVGPHTQEAGGEQPPKVQPTVATHPHLFDTLQKVSSSYSVLVTASRQANPESKLSEFEQKQIRKRIEKEREEKKYLNLFPELIRKSRS